ncbi:spore wall protein 2-like [Lactuca sativa]|uniref:spore wall protein 2-like n=1 Tax=Lactuca sativa TaxID=4236 RepID=UPI0022AEF00D|nr:spore wall protein 2-like [Lactuca sativa]
MRETFEKDELGNFGSGDFNDEFVEEELNEEDYEEIVMIKYRKLDMLIEDGINKFVENITLNHLKNGNDDIQDDNSDNDEDYNGDDNDEEKKKNVGRENIEGGMGEENDNVKGGEERQGKNKDEGRAYIERADGEVDETDYNDQGLDDMNLHDESVENDKDGNNEEKQNDNQEEQNVEGGGMLSYGKNIEGKNAKKGEGRTGEEPRRVGEGVEGKNTEGRNAKKGERRNSEEPKRVGEGVEGKNMEGKIELIGTNVVEGEEFKNLLISSFFNFCVRTTTANFNMNMMNSYSHLLGSSTKIPMLIPEYYDQWPERIANYLNGIDVDLWNALMMEFILQFCYKKLELQVLIQMLVKKQTTR